jgi:hypothetical protein
MTKPKSKPSQDTTPRSNGPMLKLTAGREPYWLNLVTGVRAQFRPISVAAILLARTAAADVLRAGGDDAMVKAGVAFTSSLAHSGIAAWEGIGDANGNPVEPTKETIDAALEHWPVFDAIDRLYVGPTLIQDAEKNV